VYRKLH